MLSSAAIAQPETRIALRHLSTYNSGIFNSGGAEISSFDPLTQRLYFVNAQANTVDVLDLSNPLVPEYLFSINLSEYGGGCNSVTVFDGWVAVAEEALVKTDPGTVVFFDADGTFVQQIEVGPLPDMITVSPDHQYLLVANEGEPNDSYSIDPEGSISIIDLSSGIGQIEESDVLQIGFENYNYIRNSFDIGDWNYTVFPQAYSNGSAIWGLRSALNGNLPVLGSHFWGFSDVINGQGGGDFFHTLTFEPVDVSGRPRATVSFNYFAANYQQADSIGYIVAFDQGSDWNVDNAVWLDATSLWNEVEIPVPQPLGWVRLQLLVKQDGVSAFGGFEDVRVSFLDDGTRIFGNNGLSSVAQDLEPEYITVSEDNSKAWVSIQENNAMAVISLATLQLTDVVGCGYKDHSLAGNGLDASDQGGAINIQTWPVKGMYQPDAIASYTAGGEYFVVSANEGDAREYAGYNELVRISSRTLDPVAFPNGSVLKQNTHLGRLRATTAQGDLDWDGDYDELYCYGGRSFSIWNAQGELVFDSGDQFEQITATALPAVFNSNNDSNSSFKSRSDDKGPEPESVAIGEILGKKYAFIGLERIGGVMVYEVTNPSTPEFVQYLNNRDFNQPANSVAAGDLGPEGILFISRLASPNGRDLLVTASEISGTISIFQVDINLTVTGETPLSVSSSPVLPSIGTSGNVPVYEGGISGIDVQDPEQRTFYAVTDRGPAADASLSPLANGQPSVHLPFSDYAPKLLTINSSSGVWEITSSDTLKRPGGQYASGLPTPPSVQGITEQAWSSTDGDALPPDPWGIDPEGMVLGNDGFFWICEEYGTSIWKVDPQSGEVISRFTPSFMEAQDESLDGELMRRRPDHGFGGIAWTPNGRVYAILESPAWNPDGSSADSEIHRLVELDPLTGVMRTFIYVHSPAIGQIRDRDWRVSELVAVNNNEFLLIEHATRNGWTYKTIQRISLEGATGVSESDPVNPLLEGLMTGEALVNAGVIPVQRFPLLDLVENGWPEGQDSPEGLAILNDSTLAVVNDNSYGIRSPLSDGVIEPTGQSTSFYFYTLDTPLDFLNPDCTVDLALASPLCEGSSTIVEATPGFESYEWVDGSSGTEFTVSQSSEVTVRATDAAGCAAYASVSVSSLPSPDVSFPQVIGFCPESSVLLETNYPDAIHLWSDGSAAPVLETNVPGPVSVTVTAEGGCVGAGSTVLEVYPVDDDVLDELYAGCDGDLISLDAGSLESLVWNDSSTETVLEVSIEGEYSFSGLTADGCQVSDETTVAFYPNPTPALLISYEVCQGDSVFLYPGDFEGYQWSTQEQSAGIYVASAGTVTVSVESEEGCVGFGQTLIVLNPSPVIDLGEDITAVIGQSVFLDAGSGWADLIWSTGQTGQIIEVTEDGIYSVQVTDELGCAGVDSIEVSFGVTVHERTSEVAGAFPNPSSNGWQIILPHSWTGAHWILYQSNGQAAAKGQVFRNSWWLPSGDFAKGYYVLLLFNGSNQLSLPVIKE